VYQCFIAIFVFFCVPVVKNLLFFMYNVRKFFKRGGIVFKSVVIIALFLISALFSIPTIARDKDPYGFFINVNLGRANINELDTGGLSAKGAQVFCNDTNITLCLQGHSNYNPSAIVVDNGVDSISLSETTAWHPSLQIGDRYQYHWHDIAIDVLAGADLSFMSKTYDVSFFENYISEELKGFEGPASYLGDVKITSLLPQVMVQIETPTTLYAFAGATLGVGFHRSKAFSLSPRSDSEIAKNTFRLTGVSSWDFEDASSNFSITYGAYLGAGFRLSDQLSATVSYNYFNGGKVPLGKKVQNITNANLEWKEIELPMKFSEIRFGVSYRFDSL